MIRRRDDVITETKRINVILEPLINSFFDHSTMETWHGFWNGTKYHKKKILSGEAVYKDVKKS